LWGDIAGGYDSAESHLVRTQSTAFFNHPGYQILAVCDKKIDKAKQFVTKWCVPEYWIDIYSLLNKVKPDIVSVCTPVCSIKIV